MARPKHDHPTPGELEILKILWDRGPSTVRQVMEVLNRRRRRHYTSVMSLLNVMADKGLVTRRPQGRAFLYLARVQREKTLGQLVSNLLGRAFGGSPSLLVSHLLEEARPSPEELDAIRQTLEDYRVQQGEN